MGLKSCKSHICASHLFALSRLQTLEEGALVDGLRGRRRRLWRHLSAGGRAAHAVLVHVAGGGRGRRVRAEERGGAAARRGRGVAEKEYLGY